MEVTGWHKSSRSGSQGDCTEVGVSTDGKYVALRDSKGAQDEMIVLGRAEFLAFRGDLICEVRAYYNERGGDLAGFDHAARGHTTLG